jgi:hypothetical protein
MLESELENDMRGEQLGEKQFLPVVSLFSGSGGLDEGFTQAGFSSVLALELDRSACETFGRNHPEVRVLRKDLSQALNGYVVERLSELPSPVRPICLGACSDFHHDPA